MQQGRLEATSEKRNMYIEHLLRTILIVRDRSIARDHNCEEVNMMYNNFNGHIDILVFALMSLYRQRKRETNDGRLYGESAESVDPAHPTSST